LLAEDTMAEKIEVHFEVQFLQQGRWQIQDRYPETKQKVAINDAVSLKDVSGIDATRVILDAYDTEAGASSETVIYTSETPSKKSKTSSQATAKKKPPRKSPAPSRGMDRGIDDSDEEDGDAKKKPQKKEAANKSSIPAVVVKILLVALLSIAIAAMLSGMIAVWLKDTSLSGNAQTNTVFIVFIISFLGTALALSRTFLAKDRLASSSRPKPRISTPAPKPAPIQKPVKAEKPKPEKKAEAPLVPPLKEEAKEEKEPDKPSDGLEEPDAPQTEPEPPPPSDEDEASEQEEAASDDPLDNLPPLSPQAEKQKDYIQAFLSKALEGDGKKIEEMNSFNKFGVNLFMAGACEAIGQKRQLDPLSISKILGICVESMGFKKADAESFAGRYADYLLADSSYMQMFQAGRNAINTFLSDETAAVKQMDNALEEWNKPKEQEEVTGPVTVMFTDIVGSTAMTQTLGDAGAQKVVRVHNRIVRDALSKCKGREIKHTGDGIMASFSSTSGSVEAAIKMQTDVVSHNDANPDLPLHLKIGINAGEPIAEDDDLFGATVQLAARIVDKAASEEIFVSEIVRGICAGKDIRFASRGGYPMKGFEGDLVLYEVLWNDAISVEEAQAKPKSKGSK
jgi:adenylate cyclase